MSQRRTVVATSHDQRDMSRDESRPQLRSSEQGKEYLLEQFPLKDPCGAP